jgi:hypothetical protein
MRSVSMHTPQEFEHKRAGQLDMTDQDLQSST